MISSGGQAPDVLRAHMGVHRTRGEPNEVELTRIGEGLNGSGGVLRWAGELGRGGVEEPAVEHNVLGLARLADAHAAERPCWLPFKSQTDQIINEFYILTV